MQCITLMATTVGVEADLAGGGQEVGEVHVVAEAAASPMQRVTNQVVLRSKILLDMTAECLGVLSVVPLCIGPKIASMALRKMRMSLRFLMPI